MNTNQPTNQPFNPDVILKRFNTSPSSSDIESSALRSSDWRKIRQLVDRAVNDRDQKKISKLNQTIHRLPVRATLAEHTRNAAEQSKLQRDFYSAIYYLSSIYLSTKKDRDDRYCVRLCSLKL